MVSIIEKMDWPKSIGLLLLLVAIQIFLVNADTTVSITSTVNSTQTWYICSDDTVQSIIFNVTFLNGIPNHVNDTGTEVAGYPTSSNSTTPGFLVVLVNQTELENYINPSGPPYLSVNGSCISKSPPYQPVDVCAYSTHLSPAGNYCLAVTNPGPAEIGFQLDLTWGSTSSSNSSNSTSTNSTASSTSTSGSSTSTPGSSASSSVRPTSPPGGGSDSLAANIIYTLVFIGLTTLATLSL